MTRKGNKSQSVVERLLEQQRQYQDWLERLHAEAAGAAPSHVTQRVASDYATRLDEVTRELGEHKEGVEQALAEAEERSEGLTKQHADRTDELAEARLRRQVGEYDEDQYEEIASRCKGALSELSKELGAVERDIDRYEEILTLIKGVREKPAAPPAPAPPPAPQPVAPAPSEAKARPSEPGRPRVSQPQMDLDELAFLRSLSDRGTQSPTAEPPRPAPAKPGPTSGERPIVPAKPAPTSGERPIVAKPLPTSGERPIEPKKAEPSPAPPPPAPAAAAASNAPRPPAGRVSDEATKSLVCTECGTKNLPSEWYCEKCGAELAPY